MCGIIGAVSYRDIAETLITGLEKLEYRGYDSAGLSIFSETKGLQRVRANGKVSILKNKAEAEQASGNVGIAHTRWATHGQPNEENAHPHISGTITLVHNGIVENYEEIKNFLITKNYKFTSQTDTEVIAHYIHYLKTNNKSLLESVQDSLAKFTGSYSFALFDSNEPGKLIAACSGSPIVIGLGINENFIVSDQLAILDKTNRFMYLKEGDIATITDTTVDICDIYNAKITRATVVSDVKSQNISKGSYDYFMLKEIYEQPETVIEALEGRLSNDLVNIPSFGTNISSILGQVKHIKIVACGTAYNSGLLAKYWFEDIANISCDVEIASEYRYRNAVVNPGTIFIAISQSGETADTLAALKKANTQNYLQTIALCNVATSTLVREANSCILIRAGVEIGVASTKSFVNQIVILKLLALALARVQVQDNDKDEEKVKELERAIISDIKLLPNEINNALSLSKDIKDIAKNFMNATSSLFIGRGELYSIALEASLKLKELSYIHAEAYAAGELKHGPLALIDPTMPVIALAPKNELFEKLKSNIEEISARNGQIYIFSDASDEFATIQNARIVKVPQFKDSNISIVYTVLMQLLSYHVAFCMGKDIDKPRNLAKSVTVE